MFLQAGGEEFDEVGFVAREAQGHAHLVGFELQVFAEEGGVDVGFDAGFVDGDAEQSGAESFGGGEIEMFHLVGEDEESVEVGAEAADAATFAGEARDGGEDFFVG